MSVILQSFVDLAIQCFDGLMRLFGFDITANTAPPVFYIQHVEDDPEVGITSQLSDSTRAIAGSYEELGIYDGNDFNEVVIQDYVYGDNF